MSGAANIAPPATLIAIPPMINSEFCRFLLVHYRVPYVEQPHGFFFSFFCTLLHGRTVVAPLTYTASYALVGPEGIIGRFDKMAPAEHRLLRDDAGDSARVAADMDRFNNALASAVTQYAYGLLLPHRDIMIAPLTRGCPWWEAGTVRVAYPLFAGTLKLLLNLSPENSRTALAQVRIILDEVAERLADGASYLVGDRLSLADLAFVTALAPLVMPPNDGAAAPSFAELPPEMQDVVTEFRAHPAGQFVQRIYREWRSPEPV
jgi:glutathione S-transferase